jgi:hypothetical protein
MYFYILYLFVCLFVCFLHFILLQLSNKQKVLKNEITSLEMQLRAAAVASGELTVSASAQPNGACLRLGTLCLVLVEATGGWLGRDDQLVFPIVREVEIHESVR